MRFSSILHERKRILCEFSEEIEMMRNTQKANEHFQNTVLK